MYGFAVVFLALTLVSWPTDQFDIFASRPTVYFPIVLYRDGYVGSKRVSHLPLLSGILSLTGKGGANADTSLTANATLFVNETTWGGEPSTIAVVLLGAFFDPLVRDSRGLIGYVGFELFKFGNKWNRTLQVKYNQGGSLPITINIDGVDYPSPYNITIGSEDLAVAQRTNSLLISLTWAILFFAVLELRVEDNRCKCKNCQQ